MGFEAYISSFPETDVPVSLTDGDLRASGQTLKINFTEIDSAYVRKYIENAPGMYKYYYLGRIKSESPLVVYYLKNDIHSGGISQFYCLSSYHTHGNKLGEKVIGKDIALPQEETIQSFVIRSLEEIRINERRTKIDLETGDSSIVHKEEKVVKILSDGKFNEK